MTVEEFARYRKLVVFFIALWLYWAISLSLALAADPIPICEILDEPTRFHLRQVTLQGTVRDVQPLDAYTLTVGSTCYGAYLFYQKTKQPRSTSLRLAAAASRRSEIRTWKTVRPWNSRQPSKPLAMAATT